MYYRVIWFLRNYYLFPKENFKLINNNNLENIKFVNNNDSEGRIKREIEKILEEKFTLSQIGEFEEDYKNKQLQQEIRVCNQKLEGINRRVKVNPEILNSKRLQKYEENIKQELKELMELSYKNG